jgi:hypothetical protein
MIKKAQKNAVKLYSQEQNANDIYGFYKTILKEK